MVFNHAEYLRNWRKRTDFIELRFLHKSWIYLTPHERKNVRMLIDLLLVEGNQMICELAAKMKVSPAGVQHVMWMLVALRVCEIRQKKTSRVIYLRKNWEKTLKKSSFIHPFGVRLKDNKGQVCNLNQIQEQ